MVSSPFSLFKHLYVLNSSLKSENTLLTLLTLLTRSTGKLPPTDCRYLPILGNKRLKNEKSVIDGMVWKNNPNRCNKTALLANFSEKTKKSRHNLDYAGFTCAATHARGARPACVFQAAPSTSIPGVAR